MIQSINSIECPERCVRGEICEGWHLLKHADINIIQEHVPPGGAEIMHYHNIARQFFYLLEGAGTMIFDDHEVVLTRGKGLEIPPQVKQQFKNQSNADVHFLLISIPTIHRNRVNV